MRFVSMFSEVKPWPKLKQNQWQSYCEVCCAVLDFLVNSLNIYFFFYFMGPRFFHKPCKQTQVYEYVIYRNIDVTMDCNTMSTYINISASINSLWPSAGQRQLQHNLC